MKSKLEVRGKVTFPKFTEERVYMHKFFKADGLPKNLMRWQPTVDAMLKGVETTGPVYLMIDQAIVKAGHLHRRGGAHIDGYWYEPVASVGGHGAHAPYWRATPSSPPRHAPTPRHSSGAGSWGSSKFEAPEAIILASNYEGCQAYVGNFYGQIGEGGDCSNIDLSGLETVVMKPGIAYAGNVTMIHETIPAARTCRRTVVRLNVPGWTI